MIRRYRITINVLKEELKVIENILRNLQNKNEIAKKDVSRHKTVIKTLNKRIRSINYILEYLEGK